MSEDLHAALSQEFALTCDASGGVVWADARAARLLGAAAGARLESLVMPGAEAKARQLLAQGRARSVAGWEVPVVVVGGAAATATFAAAPHGGDVLLVGSLVPERYAAALGQVSATAAQLAELHRQATLQREEIERKHEELLRLHRELDDSGRGVVALHAELDDQAETIHRVTESRARIVANVSHEFRTPVNAILGLSRLLLSEADGPLTAEQARQVGFIRQSAETLSALANDLLDLTRLEVGKFALRASTFGAGELFAALRGMLRPLLPQDGDVALVFEDPGPSLGALETDEGKLSQVLRNLISNAIKFTERGEVRVSARAGEGDTVAFRVRDTGVGIAPADQERIFEEFTQLDTPLHARAKGSGLGLALSRHLAHLLGGEITVESRVGEGSTFTLTVPRAHPDVRDFAAMATRGASVDPSRAPVLVVEDDRQTLFLYEKYLEGSGFQVLPVRTIEDARAALRRVRPAAVVLDVMLEGETSWSFLTELKASPDTHDIPALVVTVTDRGQKARALGADEFVLKPVDRAWLLKKLAALARRGAAVEKVLVIDDDPVARYLVQKLLAGHAYAVIEAANGAEGVRVARSERPDVIVLDFVMPETTAFEVLDELKRDPITRPIPVIICTSATLSEQELERLRADATAVVSKQSLSREVAIARIREALVAAGVRPSPPGRSEAP